MYRRVIGQVPNYRALYVQIFAQRLNSQRRFKQGKLVNHIQPAERSGNFKLALENAALTVNFRLHDFRRSAGPHGHVMPKKLQQRYQLLPHNARTEDVDLHFAVNHAIAERSKSSAEGNLHPFSFSRNVLVERRQSYTCPSSLETSGEGDGFHAVVRPAHWRSM